MPRNNGISIFSILCIIFLIVISFFAYKYCVYMINENSKVIEISNVNVLSNEIFIEPLDERTRKIIKAIESRGGIVREEKYTKQYETKNGEEYSIIGTIKIDKINLEYDILSETSTALLRVSVNKYWGPNPNEEGNLCILGHNWFDSRFFGQLHKLELDDVIEITDSYGITEEYYVYDKYVVEIEDTTCTSQLTDGKREVTLITCYNDAKQRLVVKAREI